MDDHGHKHTFWNYLSPSALLGWFGLFTLTAGSYFTVQAVIARLDELEAGMGIMQDRVVSFFDAEEDRDARWEDSEDEDFDDVREILRDLRSDHRIMFGIIIDKPEKKE